MLLLKQPDKLTVFNKTISIGLGSHFVYFHFAAVDRLVQGSIH